MTRSILPALFVALVAAVACDDGPSTPAEHAEAFCERLVDECDADLHFCDEQLEIDDIEYPGCEMERAELLACASDQTDWACPDSSTLYAGASYTDGRGYSLNGYTAVMPAECDVVGTAYERCRTCGPNDSRAPVEMPGGSYQNSCFDCQYGNGNLSCDCWDDEGIEQHTSIDMCECPFLAVNNFDGTLRCG